MFKAVKFFGGVAALASAMIVAVAPGVAAAGNGAASVGVRNPDPIRPWARNPDPIRPWARNPDPIRPWARDPDPIRPW